MELDRLYSEIARLRERRIGTREFSVYEERFQWPLGAALILLLVEFLLPETPARRRAALLPGLLLSVFLVGFGPWVSAGSKCREGNRLYHDGDFPAAARAYEEGQQLDPSDARLKFNLGAALYQQQQWARGAEQFERAAEMLPDEHQAAAHYNLGNCQYRAGRYDQAVESYRRALRLDPSDRDAKHNLELALKKLSEQEQQQQQQQEQEGEKQEQQQSDQQEQQPQQGEEADSEQAQEQEAQSQDEEVDQDQAEPQAADQQQAQETEAKQPEGEGQQQAQPMTVEEAVQLLRAAQQGDEETQQMLMRVPEVREAVPGGKDW
jgi:Ca-activated chloride channel family protein